VLILVTGKIEVPVMRHAPQHGFTLLELMVVVVLIGIILTFVVGSVGDGGRRDRIQREAQRLTALVELVGEEAVLKSTIIGLRFGEHGYEFMRYSESQWQGITDDGLLKPRTIDDAIVMELLVEGFSVGLGEVALSDDEEDEPKPQVIFLPSGERTAFELSLIYEDDESGFLLNVPPLGPAEQRLLEARR
jgi:general secretion pathway protein H